MTKEILAVVEALKIESDLRELRRLLKKYKSMLSVEELN